MSAEYKDKDVRIISHQAERDLNSHSAKHGHSVSDTGNAILLRTLTEDFINSIRALESGVDAGVTSKFPGSAVVVGSAASGAGDNREIPVEEGGDIDEAGR